MTAPSPHVTQQPVIPALSVVATNTGMSPIALLCTFRSSTTGQWITVGLPVSKAVLGFELQSDSRSCFSFYYCDLQFRIGGVSLRRRCVCHFYFTITYQRIRLSLQHGHNWLIDWINCMEPRSSSEVYICSATKEIPRILWKLEFITVFTWALTDICPEPHDFNPYPINISLRLILLLSTHLRLGLPIAIFS
jgi:hypothetical protein